MKIKIHVISTLPFRFKKNINLYTLKLINQNTVRTQSLIQKGKDENNIESSTNSKRRRLL